MPSSTISTIQSAPSVNGSYFLSLPYDIRLRIYEIIYYRFELQDFLIKYWSDFDYHHPEKRTALLHTCRQTRNEVLPIFFRKVCIGDFREYWCKFLQLMGPQNISFVKNLTIEYLCTPDSELSAFNSHEYGYEETCNGWYSKKSLKEDDRWANVFEYFKEARPTLQLLAIHLQPCAGYDDGWRPMDEEEQELKDMIRRRMTNRRRHRRCRVFKDMNIQKHILFFSNARKILLYGQFNPLLSLLLHREHGSIVKRSSNRKNSKNDYCYLENLNPEYLVNLENFTESEKMKGVYYENVEEKPQEKKASSEFEEPDPELEWKPESEGEEEQSEPESEMESAKLGIHQFLDKEDDELDRWDFPDMPFLREVVPRITQASPVTGNA